MSDLRKAAEMALEALDSDHPDIQLRAAITLRAALAQPEPPQRTPLTKQQIKDIDSLCAWGGDRSTIAVARAIERAHGIRKKNE
jgi:hypothetical protein